MKKRLGWLDIIKGICIIFVVLFHISYKAGITIIDNIWHYLSNLSDLYKVTIFYCVAGITLNNEKIKESFPFLFHKFKKLYLKAIIIGLVAILLHNTLIRIGFYKLNFDYSGKIMIFYCKKDYLKNIIYTILLGNREVILGAFWFVYSLIICFVILTVIELVINKFKNIKNKRETRLFVTFCLMFLSILFTNKFNVTIPRFSNSLVGVFLIDSTNYISEKYKQSESALLSNKYLLFCTMISFLLGPLFGRIAMNKNIITSPYFLITIVFSTLYLFVLIAKKMENIRVFNILKYIGKNSFSIMAFHFIGFKIGGILLNFIGIENDISLLVPNVNNFLIVIYYFLFGIVISLLINYLLKKYFKFEL